MQGHGTAMILRCKRNHQHSSPQRQLRCLHELCFHLSRQQLAQCQPVEPQAHSRMSMMSFHRSACQRCSAVISFELGFLLIRSPMAISGNLVVEYQRDCVDFILGCQWCKEIAHVHPGLHMNTLMRQPSKYCYCWTWAGLPLEEQTILYGL